MNSKKYPQVVVGIEDARAMIRILSQLPSDKGHLIGLYYCSELSKTRDILLKRVQLLEEQNGNS